MKPFDPRIVAHATPSEREICDLLAERGDLSTRQICEALGISENAIYQRTRKLKARAARAGIAPESDQTVPIPPGYHARGHSTLYAIGEDGETRVPKLQWVKTQADLEDRRVAFEIAAQEMAEPLRGALGPVPPPPDDRDADTLCVYPIGDHHLGMLAWHEETGESYDTAIAESLLLTAVDQLVSLAPPSHDALLVLMGDFFHADNRSSRTEASGNILDVDGRYARVIRVAVRLIRRSIDRILERHASVRVVAIGGNHDYHSALWLSITLSALYEREPRVAVDTSPADRRYHRFGASLLGLAHGHGAKLPALPGIMAAERGAEWGDTQYHHWYTGHRHQQLVHSFPACSVEVLEVLPPGDSWHVGQGYIHPGRSMVVDVWDRVDGRVCRHTAGIRRIHRAIAAAQEPTP